MNISKNISLLLATTALTFSSNLLAATPASITDNGNDGNVAENTVDNDATFSTRWSANGNDGSQWVQYDFGSSTNLSGLNIAFYKGADRNTYFKIQSSTDAANWTTQVDLSANGSSGSTTGLETHSFTSNVSARYFRIQGFGNSSNTWNSITDVEFNDAGSTGNTTNIPGTIQAEDYTAFSDTSSGNTGGEYRSDDVDIQNSQDTENGYNVGWIKSGEWLEFPINVTTSGNYTADVRVASTKSTGAFDIQIDGSTKAAVYVAKTNGWHNWATQTVSLGSLSAGNHTLRINITGSDFNLNWVKLTKEASQDTCESNGQMTYNGECSEYSEVYEAEHGEIGENDHLISLSPIEMSFDALAAQHTTPNGNGWRHELKIKSSGDYRVGMTELYELFKAKIHVNLDPGAKTIVAQHHAADTATITKLYIADLNEGGFEPAPDGTESDSVAMNGIFDVYIRLAKADGSGETKHLLTTVQTGDSFYFEEENDHGVVTVKINGQSLESISVDDSSASYFKFGNYLQAQNPETNEKLSSDEQDLWPAFYAEYFSESVITFTEMSYIRTLD